jgi:hypothetical protein
MMPLQKHKIGGMECGMELRSGTILKNNTKVKDLDQMEFLNRYVLNVLSRETVPNTEENPVSDYEFSENSGVPKTPKREISSNRLPLTPRQNTQPLQRTPSVWYTTCKNGRSEDEEQVELANVFNTPNRGRVLEQRSPAGWAADVFAAFE